MKNEKILNIAFLLVLFSGCGSLSPTEKVSAQTENSDIPPKETITTQVETRDEQETIEENYDAKFIVKLLETGEFHGDEVKAKSGETWLGLFKRGDDYFLSSTKIKVETVYDAIVDDEEKDKKTGKGVSVNGKNQSVFLLKNANFLKQGKVKTVFYGDRENSYEEMKITNQTNKTFKLNDITYNLFVTTDEEKEGWVNETSELILTDGKTEQIIYPHSRCADCSWSIYWAGDLDGDGKLDLYFDLNEHYNVSQKRLFLSSQAEKGKLVKEVANFRIVGC